MSDGVVRETLCTNCAHRPVCKNKELYLEYLSAAEKMYLEYPKVPDFIEYVDPKCKYYLVGFARSSGLDVTLFGDCKVINTGEND